MEIKGKILAVLEERSGTSQRTGNKWRCGQYVTVLYFVGLIPLRRKRASMVGS